MLKELKELLKKNPNVETLVEWLDSIVDGKVSRERFLSSTWFYFYSWIKNLWLISRFQKVLGNKELEQISPQITMPIYCDVLDFKYCLINKSIETLICRNIAENWN